MTDVKWIKITTDMFDNSKIKQLRRIPEGNNVVLIWVMLLTMAGKCNAGGMIILTENIPYTVEMLADELKFEITTVQMALEILQKFGMINTDENCFAISNWDEYQNVDGMEKIKEQTRNRVAKYREKKKLECNATVTLPVTQSSYSYSNKSNIYNLLELLDTEEYIYINNTNLKKVITEWLEYKEAKGKQHLIYAEKSLKGLIDKFVNMEKECGIDAVEYAVKETITNGWQGIVWEKTEEYAKKNKEVNKVGTGNIIERIGKEKYEQLKAKGFSDKEIEQFI